MILGVPALYGVLIVFVDEQPLVARVGGSAPYKCESTGQLVTVEIEMQIAVRDGLQGIGSVAVSPGSPVPHDHVARPVLARWDHAFEVEVVDGMVFDVNSHSFHVWVERWPFGHSPAQEHPGRFEPQVIVQRSGAMALHHKPPTRGSAMGDYLPVSRQWYTRHGETRLESQTVQGPAPDEPSPHHAIHDV